jgi:hypothetical protein
MKYRPRMVEYSLTTAEDNLWTAVQRLNIPTVLEYWPRMVEYSLNVVEDGLNTDSEVQARMVEYSRGQTAVQCWSHTAVDYRPTILVQPQ